MKEVNSMKNRKKKILIIIIILFVIACIFFGIDYQRAKKGESPLFCIQYSVLRDGGTKEYIGLGYKVIEYHKLNGYTNIHIGTIFLKYDNNLTGGQGLAPIEIND